jgi:hypothetical protein
LIIQTGLKLPGVIKVKFVLQGQIAIKIHSFSSLS